MYPIDEKPIMSISIWKTNEIQDKKEKIKKAFNIYSDC